MTVATKPLNLEFPNKENAVEDGMPLLCSILFGFSGLYFAAVCIVTDSSSLGVRTFSKFPFLSHLHFLSFFDFPVRYAIMTLTVLCCASFYLCVMAALYAKMYNTSGINIDPATIWPDQRIANDAAINRAKRKRQFCINLSIVGFNIGILFLPLSLFVFLPDRAMSVTVFLYILSIIIFFSLKKKLRNHFQ